MCVYCMVGDFADKYWPFVPQPTPVPTMPIVIPAQPWPLEQLSEFLDILRRIKALEDKLGCPCEPSKKDYIKVLEDRIKELEKKVT